MAIKKNKSNNNRANNKINKIVQSVGKLNDKNIIEEINLSIIKENPYQPRLVIEEDDLLTLVNSIKENDLLQPVIAKKNQDNTITLIAGHRRLEAHRRLGLQTIKVIILKDITDKELASYSLIENTHRKDLTYIEIAHQYDRLLKDKVFNTIQDLALAVGQDKSQVGKIINLLKLSDKIIEDLRKNKSISDIKSLDTIRRVNEHKIQEELYFWYINENISRDELMEKVTDILNSDSDKEKRSLYKIKNSKNKCAVTLPTLTEEQMKKLNRFLKKLV